MSDLLCVLNGLGLTQYMDLDLAGIGKLFLDLLCDITSEQHHLILRYLLGLDHDTDLTAGLNGIAACDAGEALGYLLKLFKTLDIVFNVLSSCAGA